MINPVHFLFLIGGSFFGTLGFISLFWMAGVIRSNIVWFISALSLSVLDESAPLIAPPPVITESENAITVRASFVRPNAIKLQGTLSGALPVRPVAKIYSAADRARTMASIRVCRIDGTPEMIDSESFSGPIVVTELRYEPTKMPTSDIFGP